MNRNQQTIGDTISHLDPVTGLHKDPQTRLLHAVSRLVDAGRAACDAHDDRIRAFRVRGTSAAIDAAHAERRAMLRLLGAAEEAEDALQNFSALIA